MPLRKWTREEISQYRETHQGIFYYNKEDANLFVPKAYGIGRTINFANPISWILILAIIGVVIFSRFYKLKK